MKIKCKIKPANYGILLSMLLMSTGAFSDDVRKAEANCEGDEVCRLTSTKVPLKILPRPRSSIFADQSIDSAMVVPTVPALSPLYVFAREGVDISDSDSQQGWYRVGATDTVPVGWMQAADVIEWHNSLILSYTAPGVGEEARSRVLGFNSLEQLSDIVQADERGEHAMDLLTALDTRDTDSPIPENILQAGVVSAEPSGVFNDIKDNLYMWPILSWATPEDGDSDERFIEFVQLVPECRAESTMATEATDVKPDDEAEPVTTEAESDTAEPETAEESTAESESAEPELSEEDSAKADILMLPGESGGNGALAKQKVIEGTDVVFVVDTTGSMGPYIESVREGIIEIAKKLEAGAGESQLRFGFVGFQDDFAELDYIAKDFTADGLVDASTFVDLIDEQVKVEGWGDHLIPERLYEGYQAGVNAAWSGDALKIIVVITDAPGIPESDGNENVAANVDETFVNLMNTDVTEFDLLADVSIGDAKRNGTLAQDANIVTIANHIRPGRFPKLDGLAENQLSSLVQNEGTIAGYVSVDGTEGSNDEFVHMMNLTGRLIAAAIGADIDSLDSQLEETLNELVDTDNPDLAPEVVDTFETTIAVVKAAAMDYFGDTEIAECDYRGWTSDRDLADEAVRALEVNVLLAHHQLDTLHKTLKDIYSALATSGLTGAEFIDSLQSVGTIVLSDPEAIEKAKTGSLASSGLLPVWLESLPYQSDIANFSADDINAMTSAERTQLELNVDQKIKYYESIIEDNERWFALSEQSEDNLLKKVTPLPLDELP